MGSTLVVALAVGGCAAESSSDEGELADVEAAQSAAFQPIANPVGCRPKTCRVTRDAFCIAGFQSTPPRPARDDDALIRQTYARNWRFWKVTDNNASQQRPENANRWYRSGERITICSDVRVLPHNGGSLVTGYRNITTPFEPAMLIVDPDAPGGRCAVWERYVSCAP